MEEQHLKKIFEPLILNCRPGDWPHAQRVVKWIKQLGVSRNDLPLLIIAGYLHDIGWSGLISNNKKISKTELLKFQPLADRQTEPLVRRALVKSSLVEEEIKQILRLIKATESYQANSDDEQILVDADNLSKTDPDHIKEKYLPKDWLKMCDLFEDQFPLRIKTTVGKQIFRQKLIELRQNLSQELLKK